MPLRMKPKKYEEKLDFNRRCMNNAKMISEFGDRDQRYAVCQSIWKGTFDPSKQSHIKYFSQICVISKNMKALKILLRLPHLIIAFILLVVFCIVKVLLNTIYYLLEYPLNKILKGIESILKYIIIKL